MAYQPFGLNTVKSFLSGTPFSNIHTGSWGTPDIGLTEQVGKLMGAPTTSQGGSNLSALSSASGPQDILGENTQQDPFIGPQRPIGPKLPTGGNTGDGGGGGDTQLQQYQKMAAEGSLNPAQQSEYQRLLQEMQGSAQNQAQIELENALSEYDRQAEGLQAQSGQLDQQRQSALGTLSGKQTEAVNEAGRAKTEAVDTTNTAQRKLLSTAQDVQKSNRNVLRALGILSSSAAGEMLNKPLNEYQTQAGELQQGLVKRINVVEDWLMSRQNEFAQATKDLESQYASLKENINRDLRFNARDRVSAVKAASAALQQRQQEIQQQSLQYAQAAKQYSDNLLLEVAKIQMYQNPTANVSGILNTLLSNAQGGQTRSDVGVVQPEDQRKKLLGQL